MNTRLRVARHHVELALEVEVVPQHLGDGLRDRLSPGRQGDEVQGRVAGGGAPGSPLIRISISADCWIGDVPWASASMAVAGGVSRAEPGAARSALPTIPSAVTHETSATTMVAALCRDLPASSNRDGCRCVGGMSSVTVGRSDTYGSVLVTVNSIGSLASGRPARMRSLTTKKAISSSSTLPEK